MIRALITVVALVSLAACECEEQPRDHIFDASVDDGAGRTGQLHAEGPLLSQDGDRWRFKIEGDAPFTLRVEGLVVPPQEFRFPEGTVGTVVLSGTCTDDSYPEAAWLDCTLTGEGGLTGTLQVQPSDVIESVCP